MSSGCLSLKIFSLDYYFSLPNDLLDVGYSSFARCYSRRIPVIRVYGTANTGQKICANIHGVLPYIFVELPRVDSDIQDFVQTFVLSLERSIHAKLNTSNVKDIFVFDASVVSGFSIYGYHESERPFIKLYLVDPGLVSICSEILLSGSVLNRRFQTYETHVPYLLQFCVDYNLFGMNLLHAGYFKFRASNFPGFPSLLRDSEDLWNFSNFSAEYLLPDCFPKCTSMELEVDISAWDILNRRDLQDNLSLNPGLEAMWYEEKMRRASKLDKLNKDLPKMPTPEELLPIRQNDKVDVSPNELYYLTQWINLLDSQDAPLQLQEDLSYTNSSDLNEFITNWLECSQTDDEDDHEDDYNDSDNKQIENNNQEDDSKEVNNTQLLSTTTVQHTQESIDLKSFISNTILPLPVETKSASSFTTISSACLEDLCRLANATEEFDAWVPTPEQLDQFLNIECTTEIHSPPNSTSVQHSRLLFSDDDGDDDQWICSPVEFDESKALNNNVLYSTPNSRNSLDSQLYGTNSNKQQEDDKTLISNATLCALSFVCSQHSGGDHPTVDYLYSLKNQVTKGDECMSQSIEESCPDNEMFASSGNKFTESSKFHNWDESSDDIFHSMNHSSDMVIPLRNLESLHEINEDNDESGNMCHINSTPLQNINPNEQTLHIEYECSPLNSLPILSPFHQCTEDSQQDLIGNNVISTCNFDSVSDVLFDSWSSESDTSKSNNVIPQVDGNMDDSVDGGDQNHKQINASSNTDVKLVVRGEVVTRRKRRRLSLRLPTEWISTIQSTNTQTTSKNLLASSPISSSMPQLNGNIHLSEDITSTPIVSKNESFLSQNLLTNSATTIPTVNSCSTVKSSSTTIDYSCDRKLPNPVVILDRLPSSSFEVLPESSVHYKSGRLTPPEQFLDLEDTTVLSNWDIKTSKMDHLSSVFLSEQSSIFSSFHHDFSDVPCSPYTPNVYTDRLSLYSQTQLLSSTVMDHQSLIQSEERPSLLSQPPINSFWCPVVSAPRLSVVNNWLKQLKLSDDCKPLDIVKATDCTDSPNKLNHEDDQAISFSNELFQQQSTALNLTTSTDEQNDNQDECQLLHPSNNDEQLVNTRQSIGSSVSVLYQAANERCFSSVQVDHTTVASLELHCCSRLTRSQTVSTATDVNTLTKSKTTKCKRLVKCGLIPDPTLDSIQVACLSFLHPRQSSTVQIVEDTHCTYLFVLIHTDLSGTNTASSKLSSCKYFNGLTNYGYANKGHKSRRHITPRIIWCSSEWSLISWTVYLVQTFDPEILIGYDIERFSWGYLVERANHLERRTITRELSRLAAGAGRTGGPFSCPGRVVLCFWRILMHEISLFEYSLETVVYHLLKEFMPRYTFAQLNEWYTNVNGINRWRTVDYWIRRSIVNLRLLNTLDLIGRTSEFARIFGIEFYHVLSRGSQYRVESLLCRIAKQSNFLLPSPSVAQRAHQRAPEAIPLNLEPESVLFIDGPVAVLDFQSLYPSVIIAYNYCYSTLMGRLSCLLQGEEVSFDLGCLTHSLTSGLIKFIRLTLFSFSNVSARLKKIGREVNISPNGVVFVKKSIREGILPRMLKQLITTRLMVKDSIKLYKSDKLGDSIVHKAREILENAIQVVNSGKIVLPENCKGLPTPRVVYGDTDSLFIHLKGYGKLEAFDASYKIADEITSMNPTPIKLKFEKIYYPCLLEAKKRYVGYAYESIDQSEPIFDAKGIETVRRDSCPFVGEILEDCLKLLFNHFNIPKCLKNAEINSRNDDDEGKSTSSRRVLAPRLNYAYYLDKQFIPPIERMTQIIGWRVRTWLSELPRYLTSRHHRYILNSGSSYLFPPRSQHQFTNLGSPSSSSVLSPASSQLSLISGSQRKRCRYRPSLFMRAFVGQPPRICPSCQSVIPNTSFTDQLGHCRTCTDGNSQLMNIGMIKFGCNINRVQCRLNQLETICTYCICNRDVKCDTVWLCNNFLCPINSQRLLASSDLALFWINYNHCLHHIDTMNSW
ncbi:DNA polymerase zeta catalytic subunit [Schistosoma japonicum]|nr:DNA polymerase zeta catalytic subunit [Schistosoma japonicum]